MTHEAVVNKVLDLINVFSLDDDWELEAYNALGNASMLVQQAFLSKEGQAAVRFVDKLKGSAVQLPEPFGVYIIFQTKNKKEKKYKSFAQKPTYDQVAEAAEELFPHLLHEAFQLMTDKEVLKPDNWEMLARPQGKKNTIEVAVVSLVKPFSSFKMQDGLNLLGILTVKDSPSLCATTPLVLDTNLPHQVTELTGWKTYKDVLDHLGQDLAARMFTSNFHEVKKEAGCRELISPVLLAAVVLAGAGDIKMYAEYPVRGVHASGSTDWALVYKQLNIVVNEAKLGANWDECMGQLAAEMMGSREEFAVSVLGKRKSEAGEAMSQVPSWGILTDGCLYKLFKYVESDVGGIKIKELLANALTMPMGLGTTADAAKDMALNVVTVIKHMLEEQKDFVDAIQDMKRPCQQPRH